MVKSRTQADFRNFSLIGKTALVTGGARGIGLQTAMTLQKAGADIILTDHNIDAAMKAAEKFEVPPSVHRLDVTNSAAVCELSDLISPCPDILVNNAGVSHAAPTNLTTDDDWRAVLSVNLDGVYYCCRTFGAKMAERGSGAIVNIGSMCGSIVTRQTSVVTGYNASKAGVNMITKTLACEWARSGVRVNAVAPGFVQTEMTDRYSQDILDNWSEATPMGRLGLPHEIASAVHYLASDAASYTTGSILIVDGGYTCW